MNHKRRIHDAIVGAVVTVGVALGLSACATPMVWDKGGATQQDYNKDSYECEKDARQSGYFGGGIVGAINMQEFFKQCMVAHGWTLRQQSGDSNPSSRPAAATNTTNTDAFANIRNAEDIQKSLDSWRQYLDSGVAKGKLTQEEADRMYREREEFLMKRLNKSR